MASDFIFTCLHCGEPFVIFRQDFNCKILRHGVFRHNNTQIHPHAPKEECDRLFKEEKIYGCGKPLRIVKQDGIYVVEICDYI